MSDTSPSDALDALVQRLDDACDRLGQCPEPRPHKWDCTFCKAADVLARVAALCRQHKYSVTVDNDGREEDAILVTDVLRAFALKGAGKD